MKKIITIFTMFFVLANLGLALDAELLNTDPYPMESGKLGKIRVKITAEGLPEAMQRDESIRKIDVKLLDTAFKLVDESQRNQSYIIRQNHGENYYQVLEYDVMTENIPKGDVALQLQITGDVKQKEKIYIPVTDDAAEFEIGHITSEPTDLYKDTEENKLNIQVTNVGDEKAENVNLRIFSKSFKASGSFTNYYGLGSLKASETKKGKFYIDIPENITAGEHYFTAQVESEDAQENFEVPFYVKGKPDFLLDAIENKPVKQGQSSTLRFNLLNHGKEKAESVSVDVIKDSETDIEFEKYSDFVGDLPKGKSGEVYFPFKVGDAPPKKNQVTLSIRYVFEDEVKTEDIPVKIDVQKRERPFYEDPAIMVSILIFAVVAILLIKLLYSDR
ncbi:MAG: COG1361 S-layer family protein [Nanobdellota archaeon]